MEVARSGLRAPDKTHFSKNSFAFILVWKPKVLELGNKVLVKQVFRSASAVVTVVVLSLLNLPKVILPA